MADEIRVLEPFIGHACLRSVGIDFLRLRRNEGSAVFRRVADVGDLELPHGSDRRRLIGGFAETKKRGGGDRHQNGDDRDHDQQLDEGETVGTGDAVGLHEVSEVWGTAANKPAACQTSDSPPCAVCRETMRKDAPDA